MHIYFRDEMKKFFPENFKNFLKSKDPFDCIPILKPIWNPGEKLWLKHIEKLLTSNQEYQELDCSAKDILGESFLQFCARTGKYHLFKVAFLHTMITYHSTNLHWIQDIHISGYPSTT